LLYGKSIRVSCSSPPARPPSTPPARHVPLPNGNTGSCEPLLPASVAPLLAQSLFHSPPSINLRSSRSAALKAGSAMYTGASPSRITLAYRPMPAYGNRGVNPLSPPAGQSLHPLAPSRLGLGPACAVASPRSGPTAPSLWHISISRSEVGKNLPLHGHPLASLRSGIGNKSPTLLFAPRSYF